MVTLRLQPNLQFINYWNTKHYFGSISRNEDFLWRMVCSIVFFDHLETSNAEMDLRNTFSSKFYVDPCEDGFYKTCLRGGVYQLKNRFNEDSWTDLDQNWDLTGSGGFLFAPINWEVSSASRSSKSGARMAPSPLLRMSGASWITFETEWTHSDRLVCHGLSPRAFPIQNKRSPLMKLIGSSFPLIIGHLNQA